MFSLRPCIGRLCMFCPVFVETMYRQVIHVLCYFPGYHVSADYSCPLLFAWSTCIDRLFMYCTVFLEIMYRQIIHVLCYFRGYHVSTDYSFPVLFSWKPYLDRLFLSCAVSRWSYTGRLLMSCTIFLDTMYRQIIHFLCWFHGDHVSRGYLCLVLISWRHCFDR
jgi:hypothetical protein